MSIRRFDTREVDVDGEFVVEFEAVPEGTWVRYADHAAELARVEKLLDAARDAARVAIDQMDVWQRACAAASLMHTQTLTANALLRAECEAWRKADTRHDWLRDNHACTHEVGEVEAAVFATDAAGILKGGAQ